RQSAALARHWSAFNTIAGSTSAVLVHIRTEPGQKAAVRSRCTHSCAPENECRRFGAPAAAVQPYMILACCIRASRQRAWAHSLQGTGVQAMVRLAREEAHANAAQQSATPRRHRGQPAAAAGPDRWAAALSGARDWTRGTRPDRRRGNP